MPIKVAYVSSVTKYRKAVKDWRQIIGTQTDFLEAFYVASATAYSARLSRQDGP